MWSIDFSVVSAESVGKATGEILMRIQAYRGIESYDIKDELPIKVGEAFAGFCGKLLNEKYIIIGANFFELCNTSTILWNIRPEVNAFKYCDTIKMESSEFTTEKRVIQKA